MSGKFRRNTTTPSLDKKKEAFTEASFFYRSSTTLDPLKGLCLHRPLLVSVCEDTDRGLGMNKSYSVREASSCWLLFCIVTFILNIGLLPPKVVASLFIQMIIEIDCYF